MITDGIHPALSRALYESSERVNFSTLKWFAKSPAHYRHILLNPPEDTDPKRLGRATHIAAFEPERFRNSIAMWDGPRRAGKDWEAFKQRNEGKELLTEDQHTKCMAIQKSVREDPVAKQYMQNGRGEVNLAWTTTTIESGAEFQCKGRIDFDAQDAIVDLKTTRDASPDAFARQVFGLHYHTQGAWYSDAYALLTGKRKPYVIVAVESAEPYVVQVYRLPDLALELGREEYGRWLDQLAFCRANSIWPSYSAGMELELPLPKWVLPDEDISGEGLTSGGAPLALEEG